MAWCAGAGKAEETGLAPPLGTGRRASNTCLDGMRQTECGYLEFISAYNGDTDADTDAGHANKTEGGEGGAPKSNTEKKTKRHNPWVL